MTDYCRLLNVHVSIYPARKRQIALLTFFDILHGVPIATDILNLAYNNILYMQGQFGRLKALTHLDLSCNPDFYQEVILLSDVNI